MALIHDFHDLDNLYAHLDDSSHPPGGAPEAGKDREAAYMSRDLARIRLDAPVPTDMDAYLMRQPDEEKAVKTLNQLEMFSMITRLGLHPDEKILPDREEDCLTVASAPVEEVLAGEEPLFLCWDDNGLVLLLSDGKKGRLFFRRRASGAGKRVLKAALQSGGRPKLAVPAGAGLGNRAGRDCGLMQRWRASVKPNGRSGYDLSGSAPHMGRPAYCCPRPKDMKFRNG